MSGGKTKLEFNDTGIHYEKIKDFEQSYYRATYQNAFLYLNDIINKNNLNGRNNISDFRYGQNVECKDYDEIANIMTFVGTRGSGKTSVMLSFMEALKKYYSEHYYMKNGYTDQKIFYEFDNKDVSFTCLDCIDGSLLERGEDIFKIVLAKIYQKFLDLESDNCLEKSETFTFRKHELFQKLENIYRIVCEVEKLDNKVGSGDSYMNGLQSLASSQKVKREFQKLIQEFITLIQYNNNGWEESKKNHFIVITVDDIDLNIKNGFTMLEKIHRYCMVANVVVLLALDIKQIFLIAMQNFSEVLPNIGSIKENTIGDIKKLSRDYLEKVLPIQYRIYMPILNEFYTNLCLGVKKEDNDIKHTILGKIYRRSGICFDSQGLKRHFYEPDSMRKLNSLYQLLELMEHFDFNSFVCKKGLETDKNLMVFEYNYRIFMHDLIQRIAIDKLDDSEQYNFFYQIITGEIRRNKEKVIAYYENVCGEKEKREEEKREERSYGELLESLYFLGRRDQEKYKPLVQCLLAYFSYSMTQVYLLECNQNRSKSTLVERKFPLLVGRNVLSTWVEEMFPKITMKNWKNKSVYEDVDERLLRDENLLELVNIPDVPLKNIFRFRIEALLKDEDYISKARRLIDNIELLTMCFTNIRGNDVYASDYDWEFEIGKDQSGERWLVLREDSFSGNFNILNFMISSMYANETLDKVEKSIRNCFKEEEKLSLAEEKIFCESSFKNQYEKWKEKYGQLALPFPIYWFDFSYNILKRVRRECREKFPVKIEIPEVYKYLRVLYKNIFEKLQAQQSFYFSDNEKYSIDISRQFSENPYIKYFISDPTDIERERTEQKEEFIQYIFNELKDRNQTQLLTQR